MATSTRSRGTANSNRRTLLARIHILKKEMGMEDGEYRDTLEHITQARSASKLSDDQLLVAVNVFAEMAGATPSRPLTSDRIAPGQVYRARKIWKEHAEDPSDAALDRFVKACVGVDKLEWCAPKHARGLFGALRRITG